MKANTTKERNSVIEQIEAILVYLGCASIDTRAMDGAIPLNVFATSADTLGGHNSNPYTSGLKPGWECKAVHMVGDRLTLSTVKDLHWSHIARVFSRGRFDCRAAGLSMGNIASADFDCFSQFIYSEIDKNGKFRKFRLDHRIKVTKELYASGIFNPKFTFGYRGSRWRTMFCESELLRKQIQVEEYNSILIGLASAMPSHWIANVAIDPDAPSLKLITDPTGVKELWRMRDIPPGRKRRSALIHWVSDHWRKDRVDPDVELYVRKHLRGQDQLTQGDLKVQIQPSETDSLEAKLAKDHRESMRKESPRFDRRARAKRLAKSMAR